MKTAEQLKHEAEQAKKAAEREFQTSEYPRLGKAAYTGLAHALEQQAEVLSQPAPEPKDSNSYEERRAARLERLRRRAAHLRVEAARADVRAHDIGRNIPFGQPILVGHHSERGHRNAIEKMHRSYEKGRELRDAASDAAHAASAAEKNNAISSDDPRAIEKLSQKIAHLEKEREDMKAFNKLMKKNDIEGMKALGFSEERIHKLLNPQFSYYGKGFRPYELSLCGAEIRRCKARIAEIQRNQQSTVINHTASWFKAFEDQGENRICFTFDGKPAEEVRNVLKSRAFKWSPYRTAWVRMINASGRYAAKDIIAELIKLKGE
jgi:hypothetical protein